MTRPRFIAAAVLLLASTACERSPLEVANSDLAAAEARWKSAGLNNYDYEIRRLCFCGSVPTIAVSVRNGVTVSAVDIADGSPVDTAIFHDFLTVDRVFALLRRMVDQNPAKFNGTYDAQLGYPRHVDIDPVLMAVDEELTVTIPSFQPR